MKTVKAVRWMAVLMACVALFSAAWSGSAQEEIAIDLPDTGTPIAIGDSVESQLDDDDLPLLAYTFEAQADTPLNIIADPSNDDFFSAYLIIYEPNGDVLYTSDDVPIAAEPGIGAALLWSAPEDGTYNIAVTTALHAVFEDEGSDGTFTLTIEEAVFETIELGDTVSGTISEDTPFVFYVLEVDDGVIVRAEMEGDYDFPQIALDLVDENDFESRNSNLADAVAYLTPVHFPQSETVLIMAQSGAFSDYGDYTLTVERYEPAMLTADSPATVEISVETLTNYLRFEGEEDQVLNINATAESGTELTLVVFDPDGRIIAVEEFSDPIVGLELLEDGEYLLMVFPSGFSLTSADLGAVEVLLEVE